MLSWQDKQAYLKIMLWSRYSGFMACGSRRFTL